jgi:hypothetical protein
MPATAPYSFPQHISPKLNLKKEKKSKKRRNEERRDKPDLECVALTER